jgi:hypothetical protein
LSWSPSSTLRLDSVLATIRIRRFLRGSPTVGSQLVAHMHLQDLGAKTDVGLCKRIIGLIAAFTMGIYIYFSLGRPLLAIKELFA